MIVNLVSTVDLQLKRRLARNQKAEVSKAMRPCTIRLSQTDQNTSLTMKTETSNLRSKNLRKMVMIEECLASTIQ